MSSSKDIFEKLKKPIPKEQWESDSKEAARKYDKKEAKHDSSHEIPLSKERLQDIAKAQSKDNPEDEESADKDIQNSSPV